MATLTGPDGTPVASTPLAGTVYALDPGVPTHDVGIYFPVPAPTGATYRLRVAANGVAPAQDGFELTV